MLAPGKVRINVVPVPGALSRATEPTLAPMAFFTRFTPRPALQEQAVGIAHDTNLAANRSRFTFDAYAGYVCGGIERGHAGGLRVLRRSRTRLSKARLESDRQIPVQPWKSSTSRTVTPVQSN